MIQMILDQEILVSTRILKIKIRRNIPRNQPPTYRTTHFKLYLE